MLTFAHEIKNKLNMEKKILLVVRASTVAQETESQKAEMRKFALELGYAEENIVYLVSAGASARKANAKYLRLLDDIKRIVKEEGIYAVGIWAIDRLGRIESYLMLMKEWFIKNGIQLHIKNPNLNLMNADASVNSGAEIAFSVFAALVRHETEEMFAKMQRGKQRNREAGLIADGGVNYGLMVVDKRLVENPKTAPHIRKIFSMYSRGESTNHLRSYLSEMGFTTSTNHILRMLKNKRYIPLVGQEMFDAVQETMQGKRSRQTQEQRVYRYGAKLIECADCGRHYIYEHGNYMCVGRKKNTKNVDTRCEGSGYIKASKMDGILLYCTQVIYNWYTSTNAEYRKEEIAVEISEIDTKLKVINKALADYKEKLADAVENKILGLLSKERYDRLAERLKEANTDNIKAKERLEAKRNNLFDELNVVGHPKSAELFHKMLKDFDRQDEKEMYELIHRMIEVARIRRIGKYRLVWIESAVSEHKFCYVWNGMGVSFSLKELQDIDNEVVNEDMLNFYIDHNQYVDITKVEMFR